MTRKLKKWLSFLLSLILIACSEDSSLNQQNNDSAIIKKYVEIYNLEGFYTNDGIFKSTINPGTETQLGQGRQGILVNYSLSLPNKTLLEEGSDVLLQNNINLYFQGFKLALSTMAKGEKSQFFIPSSLAFGDQIRSLNGHTLASNSVLLLEIEVKDIFPEDQIIDYYLRLNNINAQKTASGLYYKITSVGSTNKSPLTNDIVTLTYTGFYVNNNQFITEQKMTFTVDDPNKDDINTNIIEGIEEGVSLLKEGDEATFIIPPKLAYGSDGTSSIPPYAILIYKVILTKVEK